MKSRALFSPLFLASICLAADHGGGTGGAEAPTLKQQLAAAETARDEAKSALTKAEGDQSALQAKLDAAEGKLKGLESEKLGLQGKLTTAEGQVAKLTSEAATAQHRATEIAASNGVLPTTKSDATVTAGTGSDGKTIFDKYQSLMKDEPSAASAYWTTNEKALLAYMESKEARG